MVKIISDSTCDLSVDLIKKYDIDICPLYVHLGEFEYVDGVNVTPDELYRWSDANKSTPKTSVFSMTQAMDIYAPYVEAGSVISSHCGPGTLGVLFIAGE